MSVRPSAPLSGLRSGLAAGLILGAIEAPERIWALRGFVRGAGETAWLAALILFFPMFLGALMGLAGGACVALARRARHALPLPPPAWGALWGGALGAAAAGFTVFALTLTVRFDPLIARGPFLIGAGLGIGALCGLAAGPRRWLAERARAGAARVALLAALAAGMVVLHVANAWFAPQSSYGVHVLMLAALAAGAVLAVHSLPRLPLRFAGTIATALLVLLGIAADFAMRNRPRLEGLLKVRTATSSRCIDLLDWLSDWDRDGWATSFIVGGEDTAPLDPRRPPPILPRDRQAEASIPGAGQAAAPGASTTATQAAGSGEGAARVGGIADGPPHLLLLTLDGCRADAVAPTPAAQSFPGPFRHATPALDSLAECSARFEAAYAPSAGTEDTFRSLFSGAYAPGVVPGVEPGRYLAGRLERAGYAVRASANDSHFGGSPWGFPRVEAVAPAEAEQMMLAAADFLAELPPGRPGFAWIHVMDLHSEVLNPLSLDAYSRARKMQAYGRNLGRVDSLVAVLTAALRSKGLAERTLLVVSADHGEEFGEHGHFHHNLALYEPAIRVPLWLSGPRVKPGLLAGTTSLLDLYPTLLEAAGLAPGPTPGRSLWPILSGAAAADRGAHYSFLPHRGFSRRYATWARPERGQAALTDTRTLRKVILRIKSETWEAYDLARDPMEKDNVAGDGLGWPDSMLASLRAEIARNAQPMPSPDPAAESHR